jgi:thiol:disulfide interchange protein
MATQAILRERGYRDLLIGQAVSAFGDWMGTVALMLACDLVRIAVVALIPFVKAVWWVYLWALLLEGAGAWSSCRRGTPPSRTWWQTRTTCQPPTG